MFINQTNIQRSKRSSEIRKKIPYTNDVVTITLEREIDISRGDVLLKHDVDNSNNHFFQA